MFSAYTSITLNGINSFKSNQDVALNVSDYIRKRSLDLVYFLTAPGFNSKFLWICGVCK